MARFDVRCTACGEEEERQRPIGTDPCDPGCYCGGDLEVVIRQVNLGANCTPTQSHHYGGPNTTTPKIEGVNPGKHGGVPATALGLNSEQCNRLGL